ncbi:PadR family transcriptional regulator [Brachybacterium sp. AOP25-B2-12]|uniref:PadR family transcriptional regulator n=1 Tax=Brachybacterium sp. AOP25-B2-12 TaxID=3457710 RepID=UPI004034845E
MQRHHHHTDRPGMPGDPRSAVRGTRSRHEGFGPLDDLDPRRGGPGGGRRGGRGRGPWGPQGGGHPSDDADQGGWGRPGPEGFRPDRTGQEGGPGPRGGRGRGGFGPRGGGPFGPESGPFGPEGDPRMGGGFGRGRGRGPHRAPRGDVRTAVLLLLAESPMHGYQLMQTIAERTGGRWSPSPGAIYPTLSQLEDEGLVDTSKEGGRKLASLTDAGRAHVEEHRATWADPFPQAATDADENTVDLRTGLRDLTNPIRDLVRSGSDAQVREAATVLDEARRSLYRILAGDTGSTASGPAAADPAPEDPAPQQPAPQA